MSEMGVFETLRQLFIYVAFPAVIVTAFLVIAVRMRALFMAYQSERLLQWRLAVAGLLPVVVLTFVVVGELPDAVGWLPTADQWKTQLLLGSLMAIGTMEASQQVSGTRLVLSFMLYLSSLGTGLLYVVMEGELARFQPAVFAIVITGGLYFDFRETESTDEEVQPLIEPEYPEYEDRPAAKPTRYAAGRLERLKAVIERQQLG